MRKHRMRVLAVLLGALVGFSVVSVGAVPFAHGQLWGIVTTYFDGVEQDYYIRLSFNAYDMGPEEGDDFGTLCVTAFDRGTGVLSAAFVSADVAIVDVLPNGDVYFVAVLRLVAGSCPTEQRRIQFWAHDGDVDGNVDTFKIGPFPVKIIRGRITAAFPF